MDRIKEWHGFYFSKLGHLKKFTKFVMVPLWRRKKFWHTEKSPRNGSVWYFSSKLDVPSKVLQKKRVVRILVFKIRSTQEIHKIRDGTPSEVEEILTYIKKPRNGSVWYFSSKLDVPSKVLQKKRVAHILVFKIRPSQDILKIRDGTPLEAEEILTYRKKPSKWIEILKIRDEILKIRDVARILFFKIWPSQEILKIRDGNPFGGGRNFDIQKKALEMDRPSQDILKIRDGTPLEKKTVARILFFKIWPSQKILKIRDGTPLEAEEILTYRKSPQNGSVWYFSSKLDIPSNVLQKKRVAHILVFKIRPSQDILKIRDGTPLEAEEILTYRKKPSKWIEWHGFYFSKLGHLKKFTKFVMVPLWRRKKFWHTEKSPRNGSVWYFSSKLDVPSKVLQKKRVVRILVFKIRSTQEIHKIRDGTPSEVEEILTYIKKPRNGSVWYFSSKLDVPSKVLQKKRVAHILVFKIRPSQDILKIRDGTPLEAEEILTYRKKPSKWIEILKIRDD
ncbi:hypothetical protein OROHE_007062 [Orobanche hederae]